MAEVFFVLVRPRRPENVGAVARVAANAGIAGLRLVAPADWRTVEAFRTAWMAEDLLESAAEFSELAPAIADCRFVAALSGRGGRVPPLSPRELGAEISELDSDARAAVVFGNESSGLSLAERALCQRQVRIPASPRQPSLNLAQAAMVTAYEIFLAGEAPRPDLPRRALLGECEAALAQMRDAMAEIGFLPAEKPEVRFSEWRELFGRAGLTDREARLLRALARRIAGTARRGG